MLAIYTLACGLVTKAVTVLSMLFTVKEIWYLRVCSIARTVLLYMVGAYEVYIGASTTAHMSAGMRTRCSLRTQEHCGRQEGARGHGACRDDVADVAG